MKFLPKTVLTSLFVALCSAAAFGDTPQELLAAGQAAFLKGDMETAKHSFQTIYELDPRNKVAIDYLRRIKAQEARRGPNPGVSLEKQLAQVILPKVEFREASIGAAVEFLRQAVAKETGGKVAANFVLQMPEEQTKTQKVTLSLANVPFTEVVRYLAQMTSMAVQYDRFAITLRPTKPAAPVAAPVAK